MWDRKEIKMRGKAAFLKNYGSAVIVALIMSMIVNILNGNNLVTVTKEIESLSAEMLRLIGISVSIMGLIVIILEIFVKNPFEVGGCKFFVQNQTGQPGVGVILDIFKSGNYMNVVTIMFMRDLFVFLWSLLFLIPGIIKMYEYRMIPYILADNPGMDRKEAFLISKQMMNGQKMEFFVLELSFYGWILLSFLTCNLLNVFFVSPYMQASFAEVYYHNKMQAYQQGYIR